MPFAISRRGWPDAQGLGEFLELPIGKKRLRMFHGGGGKCSGKLPSLPIECKTVLSFMRLDFVACQFRAETNGMNRKYVGHRQSEMSN